MSYSDNSDSNTDTTDHSITTSVSIRVTPIDNYFVSWGILWSAFVITSIVATWQVYREHRIFHLRRLAGKHTTSTNSSNKKNAPRSTLILGSSNNNGDHDDDVNNNRDNMNEAILGDGESVSTADLTRSMVRDHSFLSWWLPYLLPF